MGTSNKCVFFLYIFYLQQDPVRKEDPREFDDQSTGDDSQPSSGIAYEGCSDEPIVTTNFPVIKKVNQILFI